MKNSNQPAFAPSSEYIRKLNEGYHEPSGLTKREYFAAMAMQGMISASNLSLSKEEANLVACQSVQFADELLKQLEL
jgi:hypothetical protein